jgi:hypothetical protein
MPLIEYECVPELVTLSFGHFKVELEIHQEGPQAVLPVDSAVIVTNSEDRCDSAFLPDADIKNVFPFDWIFLGPEVYGAFRRHHGRIKLCRGPRNDQVFILDEFLFLGKDTNSEENQYNK